MTATSISTATPAASAMLRSLPAYLLTEAQYAQIQAFTGALEQLGVVREHHPPAVRADRMRELLERFLSRPEAQRTMASLTDLPGSALLDVAGGEDETVGWLPLCRQVTVFDPRPSSELTLEPGVSYHMGSLIESVRSYFPSLETELIDPQLLPMALNDVRGRDAPHQPAADDDALRRIERLVYRNLGWWGCLALALLQAAARISSPPGWAAWPALVFLLTASFGGWTMTILGSAVMSSAR